MNNSILQELLSIIGDSSNEDIAGANWLDAANIIADLPSSVRKKISDEAVYNNVQSKLFQLYNDTEENSKHYTYITNLLAKIVTDKFCREKLLALPPTVKTVRLLAMIPHDTAIIRLVEIAKAFQNTNLSLSSEVLIALGKTRNAKAVDTISAFLSHPALRQEALNALAVSNTYAAILALFKYAREHGYDQISKATSKISNPNLETLVIQEIQDVQLDSQNLISILGQIGGEVSVEYLKFELEKYRGLEINSNSHGLQFLIEIERCMKVLGKIPLVSAANVLMSFIRSTPTDNQWLAYGEIAIETLASMPISTDSQLMELMFSAKLHRYLKQYASKQLSSPIPLTIETQIIKKYKQTSKSDADTIKCIAISLGKSETAESNAILLEILEIQDDSIQDEAAMALAKRHVTSAAPRILSILKQRIATREPIDQLLSVVMHTAATDIIPTMDDILNDDEQFSNWIYAVRALGRTRDPRAVPVLINFINKIQEENDGKHEAAIAQALTQIGSRQAVSYLIDRFDNEKNNPEQNIRIIGAVNNEKATPVLKEKGLTSKNVYVRMASVGGLRSIGTQNTISGFLTALRDEDDDVRLDAERGLQLLQCKISNHMIINQLIETISEIAGMRENSINFSLHGLFDCLELTEEKTAHRQICPQLLSWLIDTPPTLIEYTADIIHTLGYYRYEPATDTIGRLLVSHDDPGVRRVAALALGELGLNADYLLQQFMVEQYNDVWRIIKNALTQPQFLCQLINELPRTTSIIREISLDHDLRVFPSKIIRLPNGTTIPCSELDAQLSRNVFV